MSLTLLEVLQNAKVNIVDNVNNPIAFLIGKEQLVNAVSLLEKGYELNDDFDIVSEVEEELEK